MKTKRTVAGASLIVLSSCTLFAQTNPPAFEVASIKQAAPQGEGRMMVRMGGDAGRVDYANVSLKDVLARAYRVKRNQITGPSWLDSERYDITAKVPEGVPTDKVPDMLQVLLAERFKMTIHKETKEEAVYALIVAKGGPKLKKSDENSDGPPMLAPDGSKINLGGRGGPGGGGPGGGGPGGPGRAGAMMVSMGGPGGNARLQANRATMSSLCDMLSNMMGKPVLDMTGIEGNYDVALDVSMEDMAGMRAGMAGRGLMMAGGPGGPGGGGGGGDHGPAPDAAPSASIFQAVQSLGLKLDPRKAPVEHVVVDTGEKVPTEN